MKFDRAIINGTIVTDKHTFFGNIYISGGKIAAITSEPLQCEATELTDARELYVLPGLIDTHVHSRDGVGGNYVKEDFSYSTAAAAAGGFTTIYEMPNCSPAVYCAENLRSLIDCVTPKAHTDFCIWGLSLGDINYAELPVMADMGVVGFKFFWGYAMKKGTYQLLYNFNDAAEDVIPAPDRGGILDMFDKISKTGKTLGIHAEDFEIIKRCTRDVLKTDRRDYSALLSTRPALCETTVIETAIRYAKATGLHLHIHHVAAGDSVDVIRRAKAEGVNITAETCPHYLALSAEEDGDRLGALVKWFPLVREKFNQDLLWQGVIDGTIDHISSDHAPHTAEEKARGLFDAPSGMAGIETMSLVMLDAVNSHKITLNRFVELMSVNPARIYGNYPLKGSLEVGTDADIVLIDLNKKFVFYQDDMHSKVHLSPFDGKTFRGKPVETILRGRTVMKDGVVTQEKFGRFLPCK